MAQKIPCDIVSALAIEATVPAKLLSHDAHGAVTTGTDSPVEADIVVLVSTHAARLYSESGFFAPKCKHLAIGGATLEALSVDGEVAARASSEGLLEHPLLQQGTERVLVVAGEGGRADLVRELCARKSAVFKLELYKRVVQNLARLLPTEGDIIEISSVAALEAVDLALKANRVEDVSDSVRLVLPSKRLAAAASALGYDETIVAASANVPDFVKALSKC